MCKLYSNARCAMQPIYPITALQKKQSEVKAAAARDVVRITENGVGAYVFCSEKVFERALQEAADAAVYEAQLASAIERGRADVAAGRVVCGTEAARAALDRRRAHD